MLKLLLYNWTTIDDVFHLGGGVTKYLQNLVFELSKHKDIDITYLSSGLKYDQRRRIYIEKSNSALFKEVKTYEIINSPVMAPCGQNAKNIKIYLTDESLKGELLNFIKEKGGFDVIHFHNIEGLPISIFELKEAFPNTKFIYTIHNYFLFCSRVNLMQGVYGKNQNNCKKESFLDCKRCYPRTGHFVTKTNRIFPSKITKGMMIAYNRIIQESGDESIYESFAKKNSYYVNKYIDSVLAVSRRVKEIAINNGIKEEIIKVSYIGTSVAENQIKRCICSPYRNPLKIAYMGYMRKDKGYYFFIDAIKKVPDPVAKDISINIVAKYDEKRNSPEIEEINNLKGKFYNISLINGYSKENQFEILRDINLGIIPVLWEDNLPQVAIEQVAYGVPILVSNLGGAQELCNSKEFVFEANNTDDFINKLVYIFDNRKELERFWENSMNLVTMKQHIDMILEEYGYCEMEN